MDTREEIIESTIKLFAEKGYRVSMTDIANSVEIKVPSLYSHFSGKDEIIYEAAKSFFRREHDFYLMNIKQLDMKATKTSLKYIFYLLINHIKNEKHTQFSNNIRLIPNEELKQKCESLLRVNGREIIGYIEPIIENGISQNILKDDREGIKLLYLSIIQGIIIGILTSHNDLLAGEETHKIIWETFWNGIKI